MLSIQWSGDAPPEALVRELERVLDRARRHVPIIRRVRGTWMPDGTAELAFETEPTTGAVYTGVDHATWERIKNAAGPFSIRVRDASELLSALESSYGTLPE